MICSYQSNYYSLFTFALIDIKKKKLILATVVQFCLLICKDLVKHVGLQLAHVDLIIILSFPYLKCFQKTYLDVLSFLIVTAK